MNKVQQDEAPVFLDPPKGEPTGICEVCGTRFQQHLNSRNNTYSQYRKCPKHKKTQCKPEGTAAYDPMKVSINYTPVPAQRIIHASKARYKIINAGNRFGKDRCTIMECIEYFVACLNEDWRYITEEKDPKTGKIIRKANTEMVPRVHWWLIAPIKGTGNQTWRELKQFFPKDLVLDISESDRTILTLYGGVIEMLDVQNKLSGELNDSERKKLTEQFGVYRRNYVIALLEDFERIGEVVADMDNSIGHSMRENERYMQTLEAKVNQLVTSLKELAVQAGEAGLLDLAKGAVDSATAITNLVKGVGGLQTVLVALAGVLAIVKRESIAKGLVSVVNVVEKARVQLNLLSKEVEQAGGYWNALKNSVKDTETGFSLLAGGVGLAVTAFSLITMAVQAYNRHIEETIRKSKELSESFKSQSKAGQDTLSSLEDLREEFDVLSKGVDSLGNNVSLSADQYARYQEIVAQILKIHPSLIDGYDKEGKAISSRNDLLQEAINLQEIIPNRIDRLKGLGNMVVPQQFYPIFKAIAEIEAGRVDTA